MTDLLPPNSTPAERAISNAMARAWDVPTPAGLMWDPANIPAAYLPWLAWAVSVDNWDPDWPEEQKRAAIAGSAAWHRIKGTRPAVVTALAELGYPDALVIEDLDLPRYGRGVTYGRAWRYGPSDPHWADYWVVVRAPITRADAERIAARLRDTVPARCRLRSIRVDAPQRMAYGDGRWTYGSAVSYGSIYFYGDDHG